MHGPEYCRKCCYQNYRSSKVFSEQVEEPGTMLSRLLEGIGLRRSRYNEDKPNNGHGAPIHREVLMKNLYANQSRVWQYRTV